MSRAAGRVCAGFYLAVSLAVTYLALFSDLALESPGLADLPYFLIIAVHFAWGIVLLVSSGGQRSPTDGLLRRRLFVPEMLAAASLLFFLFSYIFATNANMDYVQRFIESGGNLRLALDTRTERTLVFIRVFPFVALDMIVYLLYRFAAYRKVIAVLDRYRAETERIIRPWAFLLTLASAFSVAIAMPSFLDLDGFPALGWVGFVPLFLVLRTSRPGHGFFYGVVFGTFHTLLSSYWLGTFSLVSLQLTVLFFLVYYLVFSPLTLHIYRSAKWARVLVFPLAWTILEYLRSSGFLGYPWALAGHSQYSVVPIIQMVSVTGVWGLSFLVLLVNSALAEFLGSVFARVSVRRLVELTRGAPVPAPRRKSLSLLASGIWLGVVVLVAGGIYFTGREVVSRQEVLAQDSPPGIDFRTVRVAQIQQNSDPRKHEYENTLASLQGLTTATLAENPELIIWSETALVPNIRRWSQDTSSRRYHNLVTEFLAYQEGLDTWLVTGNDDYELIAEGETTTRLEYNAAVFFSDSGERTQTYRKIRLVPFTESFPYREHLPGMYDLLLNFDVHFWEPGEEQTVFEHPGVRFSTPICYEDVFPNYVRGFVTAGAEAIFNISNDYWSLTEVQAKQHFVAGLFRSVENRRPVLRTTASGLTGQIDAYGRIIQTAPYYEEAALVSDVRIPAEQPETLYTRYGDYFPLAAAAMLVVIWFSSLIVAGVACRRERAPDGPPAKVTPPGDGAPKPTKRRRPERFRPLQDLGRPLGRRAKKRQKKAKTDWRSIWDT